MDDSSSSTKDDGMTLNADQRDVVLHRGAPLLVFAAAGTGKTQALTARIAHIVRNDDVPPDRVLALTFTRRAAGEMRRRAAEACGCLELELRHVGTFHSICMNLLRRYGDALSPPLGPRFTVLDPADSLKLLNEKCLPQARATVGVASNDDRFFAGPVMRAIEDWRNRALEPEHAQREVDDLRRPSPLALVAAAAYRLYRQVCAQANVVDFGDLILHVLRLLEQEPRRRAECQARLFAHMLVDEFQDTNPAQMKLIELLCGHDAQVDRHVVAFDDSQKNDDTIDDDSDCIDCNDCIDDEKETTKPYRVRRGGRLSEERLMVVGDDYQAIHEWRGATVRNIMEFSQNFPSARVVHLELNYRSQPRILSAAGSLISNNPQQHHKRLLCAATYSPSATDDNKQGGQPTDDDDHGNSGKGNCIRVNDRVNDVWEEAQAVASEIARAVRSDDGQRRRDPGDFAVLFRVNAQSQPFEEELKAAGVPYELKGASSFFARAEIKDCMAYARCVLNPRSDADFRRIVNNPSRRIGPAVIAQLERDSGASAIGQSLWEAALRRTQDENDNNDDDDDDSDDHQSHPRKKRSPSPLGEFVRLIGSLGRTWADEKARAGMALTEVLERSGYLSAMRAKTSSSTHNRDEAEAKLANVNALVQLACKAASRWESSLRDFVDRCMHDHAEEMVVAEEKDESTNEKGKQEKTTTSKAVLMTMHASKGLEFPVVYMVGMYEDMLPYYKSVRENKVAEERRLCYVGVTRAREEVRMFVPRFRNLFGKTLRTTPSRFIAELEAAS